MRINSKSSDIRKLNESDIIENVGEVAFERGRVYWEQGRVLLTELTEDLSEIRARVAGSKKTPYSVSIDLMWQARSWMVASDCTCPIGFNCKHVAAVLMSIIKGKQSAAQPESTLSPHLSRWLGELERVIAPEPPTSSDIGKQVLLYVIKTTEWQDRPLPRVSLYVTKKLKSGLYSGGREKDFSIFAGRSSDFLSAEDFDIANLVMFGSRTSAYGSWYQGYFPDSSELVDVLLRRLLSTKRCHFQDVNDAPLKLGEPKTGQISFVPVSDGRQAAKMKLEGNQSILWSECPWYVDRKAGTAGPIVLPIPQKVANVILAAPLMTEKDATKVCAALLELKASFPIPLPKTDKQFEVRKIAPRAHLKLHSRPDKVLQNLTVTKGELSFSYGEFKFADGQSHIELEQDGKTIIVKPDREAETDAVNKLIKNGLVPNYSGSYHQDRQFDVEGDQARGWIHVAQNVDKLRALNFDVDVDSTFAFNAVDYEGDWQYDLTEEDSSGWFNLDLGVEFEGRKLSLLPIIMSALEELREPTKELSSLNIDGKFYAKMEDGRLLGLPFERVERILKILIDLYDSEGRPGRITLAQALNFAAIEESVLLGSQRLREIAKRLKSFEGISELAPPQGLKTELRSYQLSGFSWLQFLSEFDLGGILADDMGLGKTVQTIAHILAEKQNGKLKNKPFLIVCPTSVVPNWISELTKFAPNLTAVVLHGTKRSEEFHNVKMSDVVLTSYALLAKDIAELKKYSWRGVVMDEAQYIKNPATKMSQSACMLNADHRICLTGTPVENHLGELWSQFHFLNPGMLGGTKRFSELFRVPIERQGNMERQKLLSSRIKPFMIRRTKVEVEKDLPPKTVILKQTDLEGAQRDLYELIRVSMHQKVRDEIANKGLSRSQITILEALLKLRQACCDPRLVKIEKARSVNVSAKLDMLTEMLAELVSEGRKVLLFSQFTSMLDLIEPELVKLRIPFVQIRGDTTDRTTPVKRFQTGDVPVFLLSLKAGGTGLNLTAADTVIHYDPWWNPAVEDQATDRAYRIGQDKPVFVYKLIASGTIEERMLELQERKRKIASSIYDPEKAGSLKFDETDLEFLFQPIGNS